MKNFTFLLLAVFSILVFNTNAKAQSQPSHRTCATDEMMQNLFQTDPVARARYENTQRQLESRINAILNNPQLRTQAIVTIPVVVHVGLPSANQTQVTDAIIQSQIDSLNFYFGSQPIGDSLRVYTPFRTTYGRSEIRFCKAQRTPANVATTGIVRTVTSTIFSSTHPSSELGSWDPTKYLNIWVVRLSGGVLGYSYLPGSFTPSDPRNGFVNDYRAFGAGPGTGSGGYHYDDYNLGKTAVHEIGHYFNLLHPWGSLPDSNPGCANDDGCGDTPLTSAPTFGCPAPPVLNSCSPGAPGVMHQNHMDYADDACMYLFTVNQCTRMTAALALADRIGLSTSNGCQPIITTNDDASVSAILTPANGTSTACTSLPLSVTLRNTGTNAITSAVIRLRVNGTDVPAGLQNFAGNLAPGASTTVNMPNLNLAALGAYSIKVHSTLPNGVPDSAPANDTATISLTRVATVSLPVVENFEGATFPSAGWQNRNPDAPGIGWARATVLSPGGTRAGYFDFYNYSSINQKDSLITPDIDMTNPPGLKLLQFDRAYTSFLYPPDPTTIDTLEIMISTNCGASFTSVWKKYAALVSNPNSLNTTTINTFNLYVPSTLADYVTETIDITSAVGASPVARILFKTTNNFGNSLFIDNINVSSVFLRDAGVSLITNPVANECNNTITPQVTVRNFGSADLTSYTIQYTIDGGTPVSATFNNLLTPGATAVHTLPVSGTIAAGNHVFRAFTINPVGASGTGDQNTINDALTRNFTVRNVTNAPAIETFETGFPSANWSIANPNNNNTWVRRNTGYLSNYSAFIDNYNVNTPNQVDDILTPVFRTTGNGGAQADSVIITWDLAAHYYPATPYDTFTVRSSPDCGNTFPNTLFNSGGSALGLADGNDFVLPIESDWRARRVSIGGAAITSGTHMVGFRNKNQFGNNMYVDNINVSLLFKRDIGVVAINNPDAECAATFTPNVTVRNFGVETVTAFSVSYRINNGTVQTANFTGQSLARNAQVSVNLPANSGTLTGGTHTITAFTSNPVTTSGTGDQQQVNDTLVRSFSMLSSVPAPLMQTFEATVFPPGGWGVVNPNGDLTWQRSPQGNNNDGSATMNNYNYTGRGQLDMLHSPNITYTGVDSITLSFDISAVTKVYPGSQQLPLDTVEVFVTNNCGTTFTSIYKKWGADLQTINNPNDPQPYDFYPVSPRHWRTETIDLTAFAPNGPLQVVFRNRNAFGNNVFIDNVNVKTRTLPASLKSDGLQILPSPFQNTFQIWHLQTPTTLKSVRIFNSTGQLIWQKEYSGNAPKLIDVDLSRQASGVYVVDLRYTTRGTDQQIRIVKTN